MLELAFGGFRDRECARSRANGLPSRSGFRSRALFALPCPAAFSPEPIRLSKVTGMPGRLAQAPDSPEGRCPGDFGSDPLKAGHRASLFLAEKTPPPSVVHVRGDPAQVAGPSRWPPEVVPASAGFCLRSQHRYSLTGMPAAGNRTSGLGLVGTGLVCMPSCVSLIQIPDHVVSVPGIDPAQYDIHLRLEPVRPLLRLRRA